MRKKIALLCATALLAVTMCIPVFAETPPRIFPMVTFADSSDFTILDQGLVTFEEDITLMGLDASYQRYSFDADELQYITWTSDSARVILYNNSNPWDFGYSITGTASVGALIIAQGTSYITGTYAPTPEGTQSVSSFVVSEFLTTSSVSDIDVSVTGPTIGNISATDQTIPLFSLKTVFNDSNYDDSQVMQLSPTALHAMLYVVENHYSALDPAYSNTGYTVDDPEYWDWVRANVGISSAGSYVYKIGADEAAGFDGWMFDYGNPPAYVDHAASVTSLSPGNGVVWYYSSWSY